MFTLYCIQGELTTPVFLLRLGVMKVLPCSCAMGIHEHKILLSRRVSIYDYKYSSGGGQELVTRNPECHVAELYFMPLRDRMRGNFWLEPGHVHK